MSKELIKIAGGETFRSPGHPLNKDNDMIRVTLDMKRNDWHRLKVLIREMENKSE